MALNDLTNQNIQDTYQKVVQTDGVNIADGTGSALPIKFNGPDLIVSGALRAQSYIVSESIVNVSSGSTVFGDSSDDSHTFNGNITSSGTISASGMIQTAGAISSSTGITASNALFSGNITSSNIMGDDIILNFGKKLKTLHSNGTEVDLITTAGTVQTAFSNTSVTTLYQGDIINIEADDDINMTAGGNTINLKDDTATRIIFGVDSTPTMGFVGSGGISSTSDILTLSGNITASGTISASGMIQTAGAISSSTGITASAALFSGNITGSGTLKVAGDIHANGNIVGDDATDITNIRNINCDQLACDADTNVNVTLGTNGLSFNAASGDSFIFNGDFNSNTDLVFKDSGEDTIFMIDESAKSVGIGVLGQDPIATLDVQGNANIISHITASGNISASSGITSSNAIFSGNITSSGAISSSGVVTGNSISATNSGYGIGGAALLTKTGTVLYLANDSIAYTEIQYGRDATDQHTFKGSITSSGQISASGDLSGQSLYMQAGNTIFWGYDSTNEMRFRAVGNSFKFYSGSTDTVNIDVSSGHITASGNISASGGTITANFPDTNDNANHYPVVATGTDSTLETQNSLSINPSSNTVTINTLINKNRTFEITGNTDGDYEGDVVYFGGTTSMTVGTIYHYKSDGTWEIANPNAVATSDGLLGVALGAASDVNGILLRGMVTLDHDSGSLGDPLYLNTVNPGHASSTVPSGNNDIVRVIGYQLHASNGQIWFDPDKTFIEVTA